MERDVGGTGHALDDGVTRQVACGKPDGKRTFRGHLEVFAGPGRSGIRRAVRPCPRSLSGNHGSVGHVFPAPRRSLRNGCTGGHCRRGGGGGRAGGGGGGGGGGGRGGGQKAVPVGDGFCGAKARFPRYQIDATWRIIVANNVHLTALTV